MDKLVGLISNIELAIRYLLSGLAVCTIFLLGLTKPGPYLQWIIQHSLLTFFISAALGFAIYSFYRILFFIVGDGFAWMFKLSAPSLDKGKSLLYHDAYSQFLQWRRSGKFTEELNGYLHYRWAVVHYVLIVGLALLCALIYREQGSIVDKWQCKVVMLTIACFVAGLWQCSFLFRVERELYRTEREHREHGDNNNIDCNMGEAQPTAFTLTSRVGRL